MPYIHCYNDNYYKPSESLSELFRELVVKPFEDPDSLTQAWIDQVRNRDFRYHRETILKQGRTNFDESSGGLTSKEKVLIYCLHYMPMHLFGSYHIFTKYLPPVNNKVVFIDFGCGPLTSGIAFWAAFAGHRNITYLGIDSSRGMRDKAQEINQYGPYGPNGDESFFSKGWSIQDYNQLPESLDNYITAGDSTQIIFNFCYFLASNTLDVQCLSNCLTQVVVKYSQHKMGMIYQNPIHSPDLHRNWRTLKGTLSTFRSRILQPNIENFSCDWFRSQNGRLIWRKTGFPVDLYFDILSNESSALSNDPFELPPIF